MRKKVILFGGTFDPPHNGHMCLLSASVKAVQPNEVIVMPTGTPPHKQAGHTASALRLAMCGCFLPVFKNIIISDEEIRRGGKSYTVDTLERLQQEMPNAQFYLPMGSDMLLSFKSWRSWQRILQLATLVVHCRSEEDTALVDAYVADLRQTGGKVIVTHGEIEVISSTEIRERLKNGKSISDLVPAGVEKIISDNNLYKA